MIKRPFRSLVLLPLLLFTGCSGPTKKPVKSLVGLHSVQVQELSASIDPGQLREATTKTNAQSFALPKPYSQKWVEAGKSLVAISGVDTGKDVQKIWIGTKSGHLLGAISGLQLSKKEAVIAMWDREEDCLALLLLTPGPSGSDNLEVGWVDLQARTYTKQFVAPMVTFRATAFAKKRFYLGYTSPQSGTLQNRLVELDYTTKQQKTLLEETGNAASFQQILVSPSGRLVAFDRMGSDNLRSPIWLVDVNSGKAEPVTSETSAPFYHALVGWLDDQSFRFIRNNSGRWQLNKASLPAGYQPGKP